MHQSAFEKKGIANFRSHKKSPKFLMNPNPNPKSLTSEAAVSWIAEQAPPKDPDGAARGAGGKARGGARGATALHRSPRWRPRAVHEAGPEQPARVARADPRVAIAHQAAAASDPACVRLLGP